MFRLSINVKDISHYVLYNDNDRKHLHLHLVWKIQKYLVENLSLKTVSPSGLFNNDNFTKTLWHILTGGGGGPNEEM